MVNPTIKKVIGKTEIEVFGEDIYCKLVAVQEAQRAIMQDWQENGVRENVSILVGLFLLFTDLLTEFDQMFLGGIMEADLEKLKQRKEKEKKDNPLQRKKNNSARG
jgi:hypothetical protein